VPCLVTCCFSEVLSLERNFSAMSRAICRCSEMMSASLALCLGVFISLTHASV